MVTMDPDLVRQQEDAERAASGLAPKKAVNGSADPIQSRHAVSPGARILDANAPESSASSPGNRVAPASQSVNPNRRALSPMGAGRRSDEKPEPRGQIGGLFRLFLQALARHHTRSTRL
jgi:hypothetical protein